MNTRDPARIGPIIKMVQKVWEANPDMRLMQLLLNCFRADKPESRLYFMEDDVFTATFTDIYGAATKTKKKKT